MFSTARRRAFILFLLGAVSAALVFLSIYTMGRIGDCTTPGGTCYEQQKARTRELVRTSRAITIATAVCARDPRVKNVPACVDRLLGKNADLADLLGGKP